MISIFVQQLFFIIKKLASATGEKKRTYFFPKTEFVSHNFDFFLSDFPCNYDFVFFRIVIELE